MKKLLATALSLSLMTGATLPNATVAYAAESKQEQKDGEWKKVNLAADMESREEQEVSHVAEGHAYIPKDTILNMELLTGISSKTAKVDDDVPLVLMDNIIINDVVVIPKGARVNAKVTKATGSGLFGRAGKLEFMIDSVMSVNGVKIPLEYTTKREAGSDDGAVAVVAAVSIVGGLFMKGKNVSFPAGSKFAAKVIHDTDLDVPLENLAEAMNPDKPHGVSITLK